MIQMQEGHISATHRMIVFQRSGHGDEVVGHGDYWKNEEKQKCDCCDSTPREPGLTKPNCSRPDEDDKE